MNRWLAVSVLAVLVLAGALAICNLSANQAPALAENGGAPAPASFLLADGGGLIPPWPTLMADGGGLIPPWPTLDGGGLIPPWPTIA